MSEAARRIAGLHLVTDSAMCEAMCDSMRGPDGLMAVVQAAVRGGVGLVQLREKQLGTRQFVERARALKALLAPLGIPLIINDRLDVALASGADGVHVGQDDMAAEDARRWLPRGLIGLSIESLQQLPAAECAPVDYYGASPVFATATKADAAPPLGLHGLRALRQRSSRPLVAIGGIDEHNAAAALAAGADGLAVVSALCSSTDPEATARRLCNAWKELRR